MVNCYRRVKKTRYWVLIAQPFGSYISARQIILLESLGNRLVCQFG
jgi:hypothetical protein